MPIIEFHLLEGRTVDQKRRLCDAVTKTVVDVLGVRREQVRILIHNLPPENFSVAGITALDQAAGSGAAKAVTEAPANGATNGKGVSA
ncbi:tautomerase family protein [Solimonas flava]|uniref:4-oxalocrotonate tautomerase-like domain-containing protein n=1 Tax=uncultured bacterium UPO41 TaxID=1776966 RepID=A0A126SXT3_9BACT|nr:tautomerase family protein [Solimonas flava]AMK59108.1 hypothetical protein Mpe_A3323 [uncultured bacterium UPO41]